MECLSGNNGLVPLHKVVKASIIDVYGDIGRMEQRHSHWAARGLKKLYEESLPKKMHKVLLTVNQNTHTATLPVGFDTETFVGIIDRNWRKIPLTLDNSLIDTKNIIDIPCEDRCDKCNQDKQICNDLVVTEDITLVVINDVTYENIVVKKLYPNGDYYLETTTPMYDVETDAVVTRTKKDFIVNLDLKPCGCLETTDANLLTIQQYCPDVYCTYYAPCDYSCSTNYGGYKIFEESGLIQFDHRFKFNKCYLEYWGFISKVNGQYMVPSVAFETLVEWTKFMSVDGNKSVNRADKAWRFDRYRTERGNMERVLGRADLGKIMQAIDRLPKFDIDYRHDWYGCFSASSSSTSIISASTTVTASGECCITNTSTIINRTAFVLNVKVDGNPGSPVDDTSTYQNNVLKNATDLVYIILAKQIYTLKDGDFAFDADTGTINISPNKFFTGDSLIAHYNKNI